MNRNVVEYLDSIAEKLPDKIAIIDHENSISYKSLRKRARSLAARLISSGFQKEAIICYLPRSIEAIIAFFAVAYSGNYYVPIDLEAPNNRTRKIFQAINSRGVITQKLWQDRLVKDIEFSGEIIDVNISFQEGDIDHMVDERIMSTLDIDPLYIIFTSGSTGRPKGVVINHYGVIDLVEWISETFQLNGDEIIGNQSPFYFDNSVMDIYASVRNGATLHLIPRNLFAYPVRLLEYIQNYCVNMICWVPSSLIMIANLRALGTRDISCLKRVFFIGEVMPNKQLNIWRNHLKETIFVNLYGPTEITDICSYYIVNREFEDDEILPIGHACHNKRIIVLDDNEQEIQHTEVNRIGELCVSGGGVSMGYFGDGNKTCDAFTQNPLNGNFRETIYHTGDLVRFNEYGELEYVARKDFQVKHLGHRIELGEIETVANSFKDVEMCCCLYNNNKKRIVLFYQSPALNQNQMRLLLEDQLPDYMLPGDLVKLDGIPLNSNGKIDRQRLLRMLEG